MFEVVSLSEARMRGLVSYFTGKPCCRGHIAERNVKGKSCNQCVRNANVAHRERIGEEAWLAKERARYLDYNRRHPEQRRASAKIIMARLYKQDPQRFINRSREHDARMKVENPTAYKISRAAIAAAYRVRTSGVASPRGLTAVVKRVWEKSDGKCAVCPNTHNLELDHILAVINGGTNDEANLQFLCEPCNRSKGANDFTTWLGSRAPVEGIAA